MDLSLAKVVAVVGWRQHGSAPRRAPRRSIPARRRRVLSNYSALSLYNGNKGKTKPHDASNTREQFESSRRNRFGRRQFVSQSSLRVIAFGKLATGGCRGGGIKDDCANLQLKGGKIWTDRELVDLKIVQLK